MLIDTTHSEETKVVILDGNKIEDLDIETSIKKQIKSNIYLAKIVRVEPSLQAAFVDYGGNRHGFLAFNEIHPDYYQIPVADKEKIKEEMLKVAEETEEEEDTSDEIVTDTKEVKEENKKGGKKPFNNNETKEIEEISIPENALESDLDELIRVKHNYAKSYKIQEVIRKNQVVLVQVVKEERGNKGAALTTYLSMAGRYCVLMPNNVKGGGISKKITNSKDRQKLKKILNGLDIPQGMSVIVRTAGKDRTKTEIKKDYDFLIKSWMKVRELTMESIAPALVLEEGNIVKRSLRDNYTKEIDEIIIAGEEGFKNAKEYLKMLSPTQAKKLTLHKEVTPLFYHYQIENQLESIHSPYVQLKSGAYLVINQTEALVAIDVNSGRATKERSIEETALKANLEAAEEISRQLRLRDLAGLIVIDFIDMDEAKNNLAVERKMKEALKKDRARIQVGKISGFGLMEISRQRRHSSVLESNYHQCPYCRGRGLIRSSESAGVYILRVLEEEAIKGKVEEMAIYVPTSLALHILNNKREELLALETKYSVKINLQADDHILSFLDYRLEKLKIKGQPQQYKKEEVKEEPVKNQNNNFDNNNKNNVNSNNNNNKVENQQNPENNQPFKKKKKKKKNRNKDRVDNNNLNNENKPEGDVISKKPSENVVQEVKIETVKYEKKEETVKEENAISKPNDEIRKKKNRNKFKNKNRDKFKKNETVENKDGSLENAPKTEGEKVENKAPLDKGSEQINEIKTETVAVKQEDGNKKPNNHKRPQHKKKPVKQQNEKVEKTDNHEVKKEFNKEVKEIKEEKITPVKEKSEVKEVKEKAPENGEKKDDNKPKKKGWWQRKLEKLVNN